jgi:hypothetical protein
VVAPAAVVPVDAPVALLPLKIFSNTGIISSILIATAPGLCFAIRGNNYNM